MTEAVKQAELVKEIQEREEQLKALTSILTLIYTHLKGVRYIDSIILLVEGVCTYVYNVKRLAQRELDVSVHRPTPDIGDIITKNEEDKAMN